MPFYVQLHWKIFWEFNNLYLAQLHIEKIIDSLNGLWILDQTHLNQTWSFLSIYFFSWSLCLCVPRKPSIIFLILNPWVACLPTRVYSNYPCPFTLVSPSFFVYVRNHSLFLKFFKIIHHTRKRPAIENMVLWISSSFFATFRNPSIEIFQYLVPMESLVPLTRFY